MSSVRVYKDNLREHIFRTMFFTDTVLFVGLGVVLATVITILYKSVFHIDQVGVLISTIFLGEMFYGLIATIKIEQQSLYKIIPRALSHSVNKKEFTMEDLEHSTGDFQIVGNYIIRKKKLIAVFEIRPFDIALLNDEERQRYYHHIKIMLHTLPSKVQLISRKQIATVSDYHNHFFALYESSNDARNWLVSSYVKELSNLIETNSFHVMKYYAVFSTPLIAGSDKSFVSAAQKLGDMARRFSSALALERIETIQLTNEELIIYFKEQFQSV